jgi:HlyD family secretion protein
MSPKSKVNVVHGNRKVSRSAQVCFTAIAAIIALCPCSAKAMQGFKNPPGSGQRGSAYSNGRADRETPGVQKLQRGSNLKDNFAPPSGRSSSTLNQQSSIGQSSRSSQIGQSSSEQYGTVQSCSVKFVDVVELPALETGQLLEVFVREGDNVPAGKVIAQVNDALYKHQQRQANLRYELANEKATDSLSTKAAEQRYNLARAEYEIIRKLAASGARSQAELRKATFEKDLSRLQIEAAVQEKAQAGIEADLERARTDEVTERIKRHQVAARFDGNIVEMFKHAGEWVTAGEPIVKIARMDKLYVQGLISNEQFNPSEVAGKEVVVTVQLARDQKLEFEGKIVIIGAQAASSSDNQFFVKAEIENKVDKGQWVLREDSRVSMRIKL